MRIPLIARFFPICRVIKNILGAVAVFTKQQFIEVNGYSNRFFGWGGEDNEMLFR